MKSRITVGASLAITLLVSGVWAGGSLKSGPQVGDGVPAFNPLHVNSKGAGGKQCLV